MERKKQMTFEEFRDEWCKFTVNALHLRFDIGCEKTGFGDEKQCCKRNCPAWKRLRNAKEGE